MIEWLHIADMHPYPRSYASSAYQTHQDVTHTLTYV